ncbi:imm11 family protein [Leptospira noguchii]|uniref:Immunity MXAN-0049 protein domain-containing protein n=1 Tax=Leptospira noguchii serovar Panama str. CZ214 TaxID=1001595 RepID=T0GV42_9LEPT|nr:DUF1629 domain-containing protein [Leptospira noguchii]EQA72802.1 hypothetical protein LEP1GSC059_2457 [Leptospira noguchii serovar Panama str. CZ214]
MNQFTSHFILDEVQGQWNIPFIGDIPDEIDMIDVMLGKKIEVKNLPIQLPVTIDEEEETIYPDIMTADLPLFSKKLKSIFDSLEINNIIYYPVELIEERSGDKTAEYFLAVVTNIISCLKSGIDKSPAGRLILKNPIIDPTLANGHRLFRLGEEPNLMIVDSQLKQKIETANLQNISLLPLEDYVSL